MHAYRHSTKYRFEIATFLLVTRSFVSFLARSHRNIVLSLATFRIAQRIFFEISPDESRFFTRNFNDISGTIAEFQRNSFAFFLHSTVNAHAHDAKHVFLFATLRNCRDQSDPLRSLIILLVPQPMSSTV